MTKKYLVTGCAGFIGSRVTELLLDQGHRVTGLDNINDAYDPRLKNWRLNGLSGREGFNFHRIDICDATALERVLDAETDAVINLAARAGVRQSVGTPQVYYDTNVSGVLNLLERCRDVSVPKFVQASTSSLYGDSDVQPFREDMETSLPLSPYAASKKAAEALCYTYHHLHGIDVTVPRYFTVYGPAGRPDMSVFRFIQWISEEQPVQVYGDGTQSRDFTFVDDIARGTVAGLKLVGYEIVNLGSDSPVILTDLIRFVEVLLKKPAMIEFGPPAPSDVPTTWADVSKAAKLLDWRPKFNIEDGLRQTVDWYIENRDWAKDILTS